VQGAHHSKRGIKPFLFSPFKAILTTRVTVKFDGQGIGENRRDLPAYRTARSMASSEISPSKAWKARPGGKLWTSFASQNARIEYRRSLHVCFDFSWEHGRPLSGQIPRGVVDVQNLDSVPFHAVHGDVRKGRKNQLARSFLAPLTATVRKRFQGTDTLVKLVHGGLAKLG
jgi:hypothetical protein